MIADAVALTHRRLIAIVRGVLPLRRPELPFTSVEDDQGRVTPLDAQGAGHRWFTWRSTSLPTRHQDRVTCTADWGRVLRVRYDRDIDDEALELEMAQDLLLIEDALRVPAEWQMGVTGILAIGRDGQLSVVHEPPPPARPRMTIVGIPYLITLEACC